MLLITKAIAKAFEKQGYTGNKEAKDIFIVAKLFNPCGGQTWYLYEKEDEDIYMAFVNLGDAEMAECGRISMSELESIRLPFGMSIERDRSFTPLKMTLEDVMSKVKSGKHV